MLKLLPLVGDARHSRQGAAHSRNPLAAAHYDPVPVIIKLPDRALFKGRKKCDGDAAAFNNLFALVTTWQAMSGPQTGSHNVFRRAPLLLARKVPEPITGMPEVYVFARPDADPRAARAFIIRIKPFRRAKQLTRFDVVQQNGAGETGRVQPFRGSGRAPMKLRKPL